MAKEAKKRDYIAVQGGYPSVYKEGQLTVIHHNYQGGEGMVVRSHKSVKDYGEVDLVVNSKVITFKVALLKVFHGDPCEQISMKMGGDGYPRR